MIPEQNADRLPTHLRHHLSLHRFLGDESNAPPRPAVRRLATHLLRWYPANVSAAFSVNNATYSVFDGANIWVSYYLFGGGLTKFRASDGLVLATTAPGEQLSQLVFDGANIWAASAVEQIVKLL